MKRLTVWLGTGVVALGVSVAMFPGAGVAAADSDSGAVGGATASESGYHDRGGARRGPGTPAEGRAGSVTRPNKANRNPKERATSDSGTAPSGSESDQPATSGNDTAARRSRADRRSPDRMAERRERAKSRGCIPA